MKHKEFKNNPLIEAQVEIRWGQADPGWIRYQNGSLLQNDVRPLL